MYFGVRVGYIKRSQTPCTHFSNLDLRFFIAGRMSVPIKGDSVGIITSTTTKQTACYMFRRYELLRLN